MTSSDELNRTVHISVRGDVQGVGYRAFVETSAAELRIDGWVRNRRDGTVEAMFQGRAGDVAELIRRCRRGPPAGFVTKIDVRETSDEVKHGFLVLPTA
jgi:acylphosphatase